MRVLKGGPHRRTIFYLADSTWTCDISTARPGERSLIFLRRMGTPSRERIASIYWPGSSSEERRPVPESVSNRPLYLISDSGRGRMRIRGSHDKESVSLML